MDEYGVWALAGVVASYVQLSDFGVTESLIKFSAEYYERRDTQKLNRLINTGLLLYISFSLVFCGLIFLILPYIVQTMLAIPPSLLGRTEFVFRIAIISFFVNLIAGVFGSLILGFQKMFYSNFIAVFSSLVTAVLAVLFLRRGYGLEGIAYVSGIVASLALLLNFLAAKHLFPQMEIRLARHFDRATAREIFGFGWKIQVTTISNLLLFQVDKIILSHFVGLKAVAFYEVGSRIVLHARSFVNTIFMPMTPAASALQASSEENLIPNLYRRSLKYMAVTSIPLFTLAAVLAYPFITAWVGPGYELSANTLILFSVAHAINVVATPGYFILNGIGMPHITMRTAMLSGFMNIILCWIFVSYIGYYGVIIGIFISTAIPTFYFIFLVHRFIPEIKMNVYKNSIFKPLAFSLIAAMPIAYINSINIIEGYAVISLIGFAYLLTVFACLFFTRYFDEFDINNVLEIFNMKHIKG